MRKNYNFKRDKLILPEYGRHIQEMVDSLARIEDRGERTRQAYAIIAVMGDLNPALRDTAGFNHKLWDHLFIMSDFKLDVDFPYSRPTRKDLMIKPRKMRYPRGVIKFKHYGKYAAQMLKAVSQDDDAGRKARTVNAIVLGMRRNSAEYNNENPSDTILSKDVSILTDGAIELDNEAVNKLQNDYKQHFSQRLEPQYPYGFRPEPPAAKKNRRNNNNGKKNRNNGGTGSSGGSRQFQRSNNNNNNGGNGQRQFQRNNNNGSGQRQFQRSGSDAGSNSQRQFQAHRQNNNHRRDNNHGSGGANRQG